MAVDPLAGKYAGWSPYNFVMNSPLVLIDPDGRDIFPIALIIQGVKLNQIVSQSKIYSGLLEYFDNNSRFDINFDSYGKEELNGDGGTSVSVVLNDGSEISLDKIDPSTFDPSEIVKYKTTVGINRTLDAGVALMVVSHEVSLHVHEVVKMIKQFEGGGTFENFVQEYKTWLAANESKAQENSDAHQTVAENTGTYKDLFSDIINILSRKENNYNDKTKKGGDRLNKWFKVSEYNKKFNEAPSYTVDQTTKQVTFMPVSVLSRFINALARATALYGGNQESAYKVYNKKGVDADYEVYEKAKKDGYVEK